MKFTALQKLSGQAGVADALFDDLSGQLEKLPLERFCSRGGWPLNSKITTIAILEDHPARLVAVLYISLTETGSACCSGDNFEHERFGDLTIEINKEDWSCACPATA